MMQGVMAQRQMTGPKVFGLARISIDETDTNCYQYYAHTSQSTSYILIRLIWSQQPYLATCYEDTKELEAI